MEKKQKILESRNRLDNALFLPDLVNEDSIASLVKEQLIQSSLRSNREDVGKIVESRTMEVANFLEMLRSASGTSGSHLKLKKDWKVKQDTDQLRVMYCEGPHGSPFHTLLAEGFADGPMDVCLCVSWESTLYKKWWPQYSIPTFKIIASLCLQKVRIGEEISLIRQVFFVIYRILKAIFYMCHCLCFMVLTFTCINFQERVKVPWPVSDREAVVHYFEIEYFKEDLILILIKTLSDTEHLDADTHGFNGDGIPQAKDTIRIDLVGGFVLQKVESNRCYFRAIFNFDIKLEFIPPSLINFISRQLLGNGHKLYQKAVGSVATVDEDYQLALEGPLYARIRQQLHTGNRQPTTSSEDMEKEKLAVLFDEYKPDAPSKDNAIKTSSLVPEITEEDTERRANGPSVNLIPNKQGISSKEKPSISPEVENALDILDQVISIVRGQSIGGKNCFKPSLVGEEFPISELVAKAALLNNGDVPESSNKSEGSPHTDDHRQNNSNYLIIEGAGHDHEVLSLKKEKNSDSDNSKMMESRTNFHENLHSKASVRMMQLSTLDSTCKVCDEESLKSNGFYNSSGKAKTKKKKKKPSFCCFSPSFIRD